MRNGEIQHSNNFQVCFRPSLWKTPAKHILVETSGKSRKRVTRAKFGAVEAWVDASIERYRML